MSDNIGDFHSEQPWTPAIRGTATQSNGVYGNTISDNDSAVYGEHSGNGIGVFGRGGAADGQGVFGQTNSPASGVFGMNTSDGPGVTGYSVGGFAMQADGDASQSRDGGGWVKALLNLHTNTDTALGPVVTTIKRYFNSQPGVEEPTVYRLDRGFYCIDFHFQVSDRYVTATPIAPNYRGSGDVNPGNPYAPLWWPPSAGGVQSKIRIANVVFDGYSRQPSAADGSPDERKPNPTMITVLTYEAVYVASGGSNYVTGFQLQDADLSIAVF